MRLLWLFLISMLLTAAVALPIAFLSGSSTKSIQAQDKFLFGVTFGGNSTQDAKALIDKVKAYTNLFVVDSWDISMNETQLTDVCNYASAANLKIMVFFRMIFNNNENYTRYWSNSTQNLGFTPWHIPWLTNAKRQYGDKFLGVYLYDEPGGKQIDLGYWGGNTQTYTGRRITVFDNTTGNDDAASRYVSSLSCSTSMQVAKNLSLPVFTADYALHWFDYKAGYDAVFAELGGNRGVESKVLQIAACRGAANMQDKEWGAIITWAYNEPPYYGKADVMLQDMSMAYQAGADYLLVFNYPQLNQLGGLTEQHFDTMATFWKQMHDYPRSFVGTNQGDVAFVLPENYGWGMRSEEDKLWGLWSPDDKASVIWDKLRTLIGSFGVRLDIVYDDPAFNVQQNYTHVYHWDAPIS